MTVEIVRMTCPPSSKTGQTTGEDPAGVPGLAGEEKLSASVGADDRKWLADDPRRIGFMAAQHLLQYPVDRFQGVRTEFVRGKGRRQARRRQQGVALGQRHL